ncbi:hypothetical protein ruthe_00792 [Rubellimicrobium thermophilum DSM 16684]|uniref:Uncharacterized protein n=1 Tax=Rubellimicrobium thermophilum DSM 16684 TaxID=1123069 RepID=S9R5F2_9RHOB|nr:hypothetical protein ruthe_00792 [Rubellimicrobium thermophilum DSM 16684]
MPLDNPPDRGEDRGDIAPLHPGAAARIEHGLQLLDDEGHLSPPAEHGRDHAGQRNDPSIMLHVLGIDEHLEGAAPAVQDHIVHGDVERMFGTRPFQLVGRSVQGFGAIKGRGRSGRQGSLGLLALHGQDMACHRIRAVGRAALATLPVGLGIDIAKAVEGQIGRDIDRLGDGAVHPFLCRRLHPHVIERIQILRRHRPDGQGRIAMEAPPETHGIIRDLLLASRAIRLQDLADMGMSKDRLDPR